MRIQGTPPLRLLAWALITAAPLGAFAQDPGPTSRAALSEQQRLILDRMARLEDKMFQLSQTLARTDPAQAERLTEAFRAARDKLVRQRMEEVAGMLDKSRLSDAGEAQRALLADLDQLLRLLIEESSDFDRDEIERLERLRKQLDSLIEEQTREKQRAEQAARLQRQLERLKQAADKLAALAQRQDAAAMRNAGAATEPPESGRAAAQDQAAIREETQSLAEKLPDDSEAQQPRPEPEGKELPPQARPAPTEASRDLQRAAEKMRRAEQSLGEGRRGEARPNQEQASAELRNALRRLSKQIEELERKLDLDKQARDQAQTREKTEKLSEQMKGAQPQGDSPTDQPPDSENRDDARPSREGAEGRPQDSPNEGREEQGSRGRQGDQSQPSQDAQPQSGERPQGERESEPSEPALGQQEVEGAVPHQREAEEQLRNEKPRKAAEQQEEALKKLEQARAEVEDALEQRRREQQEELLAALEARFAAMLARQQKSIKVVNRLDEVGRSAWSRSDQLELAAAAEDQAWVADEADKAARLLKEEGTTVVFPEIVAGVRDDAREAATRLTAADTGPGVRQIQADLADTLSEMIEAIRRKRQENSEQQDGQNQGGNSGGNPPLLPDSAELKMLRACQVRINRATESLEERRAAPQAEGATIQRDSERLARRQADVAALAQSLNEARARRESEAESPR